MKWLLLILQLLIQYSPQILKLAEEVVEDLDKTDSSPGDKRKQAKHIIKKKYGDNLPEHIINLAIELAVSMLKKRKK